MTWIDLLNPLGIYVTYAIVHQNRICRTIVYENDTKHGRHHGRPQEHENTKVTQFQFTLVLRKALSVPINNSKIDQLGYVFSAVKFLVPCRAVRERLRELQKVVFGRCWLPLLGERCSMVAFYSHL